MWLIVAAAGIFAAFPGWYATMFSGFYLAFLLLLVALIARGVSFEFRGKRDSARWRRAWDAATTGGSLLAPLLIGVALGNLLHGVPIGTDQEYAGTFTDLLNPLLVVHRGHGGAAVPAARGQLPRAQDRSARSASARCASAAGSPRWRPRPCSASPSGPRSWPGDGLAALLVEVVAVLAAVAAAWLLGRGRDGRAFAATSLAMAAVVVSIFVNLYPRVMVSTLGSSTDLTVTNTSSAPYSLKVMTVAAAVLFPVVLAYQGWTYYVFRRRVGGPDDTAAAGTGPVAGRAR